ncbi:hypothetical protein ABK040_014215 [Willaertia magna]
MPTVDLFFSIENIPATEDHPFQLFVKTNEGDYCIFESTDDISSLEQVTAKSLNVKNSSIVDVNIKIAKRSVNSWQQFDIAKQGPYILIKREEGKGLQIVQRLKDDKFGTQQVVVTGTPKYEQRRQGFIVDPKTGEKKYVTSSSGFSKGTTSSSSTPTKQSSTTTNTDLSSLTSQLEKLASLRDKGILSEEEFQQQKKKLLQ